MNAQARTSAPDLVIVDTETGGLDPLVHSVIDVALIRVDALTLKEIDRFASRICSYGPVDSEAAKVNGYDEATWTNSPELVKILPDIVRLVRGARWVGSNPTFDMRFLNEDISGYLGGHPSGNCAIDRALVDCADGLEPLLATRRLVDVSSMAEPLIAGGHVASGGLDTLGAFFGLPARTGPHRAEDDAERTLTIYRRLLRFFGFFIPTGEASGAAPKESDR